MSKFIVFEGLDGTGKTTQIRLLAEYLRQRGEAVFTDVEPSGLPTGRFLRQLLAGEFPSSPWATAALFLADRINQNVDEKNGIIKHLAAGKTVLLDRYYYSTFAYQGHATDLKWAMDIHFGCPEITKPDLTLFLTMSPEKCIKRITANRAAEEMEIYETVETLTAVSRQFDTVFNALKEKDHIVYIDADGTVEAVHARIVAAVEAAMSKKKTMGAKKLLLFDFDGTVTDNSQGIFNCVRYAAEKNGFAVPDEATLRRFVGPPLYESFVKYCGADHETALAMVDSYRERYRPIGTTEAVLYPDMQKTLAALKAAGFTLAICSGKPQEFVEKIAKMLGVHALFSGFYCPSLRDTSLEKADYIAKAMCDFGATKEETLMIGDTKSDILAAKKAGVESIGVTYGFAAPGELAAAGTDFYAGSAKALYTIISGKELV